MLLLPTPSFAQSPILTGIDKVALLTESLEPDDEKCGLYKDALQTAVAQALLDFRLRVVASDDVPDVYVNVNTVFFPPPKLCVSSVVVRLQRLAARTMPNDKIATVTEVLWENGGLLSSDRKEHSSRINTLVRELARQLVTAIRLSNQ
jgi:16S rRNA A1518/A1519 N6-dimethyltransferase RsmA/KsgA/DIM1 with predicted DNA glycosylase/AP lyase activity